MKSFSMFSTIKNLINDESGATAIEYGLIAALVSVAVVAALSSMCMSLSAMFGGELDSAVAGAVPSPCNRGLKLAMRWLLPTLE
jgi:pilus assembly protein Flp/PilA